jgi:hypothetical protein
MKQSYEEVSQEVNELADGLGWPVDEKVKNIVVALRLQGFSTEASCEGHMEKGLQYPWIQFCSQEKDENIKKDRNTEERSRLIGLIEYYRKNVNPEFEYSILDCDDLGRFRLVPAQEIVDGNPTAETLSKCQQYFDDLAQFLIKHKVD